MTNSNGLAMAPQAPSAISYADPAAVAAAESAKARIQAAYIMAMQRPRSYDQSRIKILDACKRPAFAEKAEYSKPVGGGQCINGPSIRFAEMALREWGNVSYENQVVYDDETTRRINVTITDLETNTTFSASIQIAKTVERRSDKGREVLYERINTSGNTVYVVKATDDEIMNKQAALVSKALRNEGLRLIPKDIIDEAIETARETLKNRDAKDPDEARKRIADAFYMLRVLPKDLEEYLGHSLDQTTPSELVELRAIHHAIKDGEAKWNDYVTKGEDGEESEAARKAKQKARDLKQRAAEQKAKQRAENGETTKKETA